MNRRPLTPPFVLLDDNSSPEGRCFLFTSPQDVLLCHRPEDVEATLEAIETAQGRGLFAAGFLYGHTNGFDVTRSARLGALAASEAISHFGARPENEIKSFIDQV